MEEFQVSPMEKEMARWYGLHHSTQYDSCTRRFLTPPSGMDLSGNTFWEFTDQINIGRVRRIVEYDKRAHYADVKLARTSPPFSLSLFSLNSS
jgi:hypothetical protein